MTHRQYADPFGSDDEEEITPEEMNVLNASESRTPTEPNKVLTSATKDEDAERNKPVSDAMAKHQQVGLFDLFLVYLSLVFQDTVAKSIRVRY